MSSSEMQPFRARETVSENDESKPSRLDEIVDAWFSEHIPNSPVSQNTEGYNHIRAAVADLKKRLAAA